MPLAHRPVFGHGALNKNQRLAELRDQFYAASARTIHIAPDFHMPTCGPAVWMGGVLRTADRANAECCWGKR